MLQSGSDVELVVVDKDIEETTDISTSGSAKKLRQSRLPFKVYASTIENSSSTADKCDDSGNTLKMLKKQIVSTGDKSITELTMKRRLSETSESDRNDAEATLTKSNKCPLAVSKKQKTTTISNSVLNAVNTANEVVVISSSSGDSNDDSPVVGTAPKTIPHNDAGTSIFSKPLSLNGNDRKLLKKHLNSNLNRTIGNKKKRRRATVSALALASLSKKSDQKRNLQLAASRNEGIECLSENEMNPQKRSKIDDNPEKSLTIIDQDDDAINSTDDEREDERKDNAAASAAAAASASYSISKVNATESELELETSDKCDESSTAVTGNSKESSGSIECISEIKPPANSMLPQLNKKSKKKWSEKQKVLLQQRHAAREEKERKLEEQKMQRQLEKKNKEMLRRKEREAKEQKRLADLELRNEEKRRKNEAKVEELRKKEDERRRKEIEKEEAELKKKKAAEAFTKFFLTTKAAASASTSTSASANARGSIVTGSAAVDVYLEHGLAFQPFEIKGDMQMAPVVRKTFTDEAHARLDECLISTTETTENASYLRDLQSGKITPCKWKRPSNEAKLDCAALENELEEAGVVIIEDTTTAGKQRIRAKFYKFHDNRRPPYYGTWSKSSAIIKPRRPFAQDKEYFDYDIDSDDEWEEDEPGESLEGSDNDKESEDDDYEVDNEWFVPHGHLSEEEMQNKDENTPEVQKLKLQLLQQEFAHEMKKKTEKITPRLIGCIWVDENGDPPTDCYKLILETLESHAIICSTPINFDEVDVVQKLESNKLMKTVVLSDDLIYKLITLVHGNKNSKKFLIKEFSAYMKQTKHDLYDENSIGLLQTSIRRKFDEIANWQVLVADDNDHNQNPDQDHKSETQKLLPAITPATTTNIAMKKKKFKKKLCWIIQQHILDKFGLSDLSTKNTWNYILQTKQNTLLPSTNSSKDIKQDRMEVNHTNSKTPTVDKTKGFKSIAGMFKKLPFNNPE